MMTEIRQRNLEAGGLDRMADGEVCFDEDVNNESFFIFGQSAHMREWMKDDGTFKKLPRDMQARLEKAFLIVRGYSTPKASRLRRMSFTTKTATPG
jgi:hypothetical protein